MAVKGDILYADSHTDLVAIDVSVPAQAHEVARIRDAFPYPDYYFLGTWDAHYTPLLEMNDPGEAPLRGSLVVTPLGKGLYVYAAVAFFRQFPAAVPGAYRLFANLVSLDAAAWARRAWC